MSGFSYSQGRPKPLPIGQGGTGSTTQNFVDLTTGQTIAGTKVFSGNMEIDGGTVTIGTSGSNVILMPSTGFAAPTFTTRSAGAKLVLFNQIGAAAVDYSFGIATNTMWYAVPTATQQHQWYAGTTPIMTLSGAGVLSPVGNIALALTKKLTIATGTNATAGTGTLTAGTVTISTTAVTASSLIFLTDTASSVTNVGTLTVSAKSAGTSFTVTSTIALDTSTFNWLIIN